MLWFLDWSFDSFAVIVGIIIFVSIVFMFVGAEKGTLSEKKGSIMGLFLLFLMFSLCLIFTYGIGKRTFSLYPQEHYVISKSLNKDFEFGFTLGELWCNHTEYNSELCKNYVGYALYNQKITALEKQIKLEKEKAQKDKIRANYEKTLKEIVEKVGENVSKN